MTYSASEGVQISRAHTEAICTEVGERLAAILAQKPPLLSLTLMMLVTRLRDKPSESNRV
jgi:hypothetical protein